MRRTALAAVLVLLAAAPAAAMQPHRLVGEASPGAPYGGWHPAPVRPSGFDAYFRVVEAHGRTYVLDRATERIVYSPDFPPYLRREYGYVFIHGEPVLVDFTRGVIHWR